ncbi:MAG TPA: RnfABCDGE type electron transport complex subunit B [Acholeplasma sp.]|nr:RnfABCDGE type electron transport complex subunit B [Acholeplasma sp.]
MLLASAFNVYVLPAIVFASIGLVFGVLIGLAEKYLHVEEDLRVQTVENLLPGLNCGGCGHPGCSGLAKAIVEDGESPNKCKPLAADAKEQIIAYLKEELAKAESK